MTRSVDVRANLVNAFRRDLVGPGLQDADLATERLSENPSRWYLTGFLAPTSDPLAQDGSQQDQDNPSFQEEIETDIEEPAEEGAGGAAGDDAEPETPTVKRRILPASIGLTVLLPPEVHEIEVRVSWGDYRTEPPLSEDLFLPEEDEEKTEDGKRKKKERPFVEWVRAPREQIVKVTVPDGRGRSVVVPESAAAQRGGGGLVLESHARLFDFPSPDGNRRVRALTVFLVNRRPPVHRFYADVAFAFQARLELVRQWQWIGPNPCDVAC